MVGPLGYVITGANAIRLAARTALAGPSPTFSRRRSIREGCRPVLCSLSSDLNQINITAGCDERQEHWDSTDKQAHEVNLVGVFSDGWLQRGVAVFTHSRSGKMS